jgi:hypothetical protein
MERASRSPGVDSIAEPRRRTARAETVRIGSEAHKALFCRAFLDSHDRYKPAVIAWPELDAAALRRLASLPIWRMAVETEGYASLRMEAMAAASGDPLVREAIALNAFEERRHKDVLGHMLRFYGIDIGAEPHYAPPRRPEWSFVRTGYGEFIDSFFAFGLFALAKRSGFFPAELVEVFEPVIQEEARHNLFFANWLAWRQARAPIWRRPFLALERLAALLVQLRGRIKVGGEIDGSNFTMKGGEALGLDLDPRALLELCLAENDRRFAPYDRRLLRPRLMPRLARLARLFFGKPKR